jgi:hypothetical protein
MLHGAATARPWLQSLRRLAKVDSTGNEVAGVTVQSYPTLKWWRKDKSLPPIDFSGGRNA